MKKLPHPHRTSKRLSTLMLFGLVALSASGCELNADEYSFTAKTNQARATEGLASMSTTPPEFNALLDRARAHSKTMCEQARLFHNDLSAHYKPAPGWKSIGENVGYAPWKVRWEDPNSQTPAVRAAKEANRQALFDAFMNSESHRANILGNFTHQIVGTYACGTRLYMTHYFARY